MGPGSINRRTYTNQNRSIGRRRLDVCGRCSPRSWTFADLTVAEALSAGSRVRFIEPGPKTSTLLRRSGYHDLRNLWSWIGRYVRERGCRAMRASMASSLSACSPAESIAARFVLHLQPRKKMSVTILAPPQRLKPVFVPVCVAGRNAPPELRRG